MILPQQKQRNWSAQFGVILYAKMPLSGQTTWSKLIWACIGGGLIAGVLLLAGGFWLGKNW